VTCRYISGLAPPQFPAQLTAEPPGHWQVRSGVTVKPVKLGAELTAAAWIPAVSVVLDGLLVPYCAPTRAAFATAEALLNALP
jgi:hypothetical protein